VTGLTAIDTNILAALGSPNVHANAAASAALAKAAAAGPVCVCGAIFAELLGFPGRHSGNLRQFFGTLGISIEWKLEEQDWEAAGLAYQAYVQRRRESPGGLPSMMLTDFLIGAHASVRNYALLTLDKRLYGAAFPGLRIETC
jgi:predicted nucleic acid-binding protein